MGSCVSSHRGTPEPAIKLGVSFGPTKVDNLVIPEPTTNHKLVNPIKTFDHFGSKDEIFFDSRTWLDSDCEDDFFSVNGDFTPSRGSTPVHHNLSTGAPKINQSTLEGRPSAPGLVPEPSPTGKKKLLDLFRDSLGGKEDLDKAGMKNFSNEKTEEKQTIRDVLPKSASGTPYFSGANSTCDSERTPNGNALIDREESSKSTQCCLPSLISCRSFRDRKKKMSPAIVVNDEE